MSKQKTTTWYGIRSWREDPAILEVEVVKETETRLYFVENQEVVFGLMFAKKNTSYEQWFPTREQAVEVKLARLEASAAEAKEDESEALACLNFFKEKEAEYA